MSMEGKKHSEETRRRMSESGKGRNHSEETKRKISVANKEYARKNGGTWEGKHHSEQTKRKISEGNKGKTMSEEAKRKISIVRKGVIPWNKGIPRTAEEKKKMSNSSKGRISWNRGISCSLKVSLAVSEANRKRIWTEESRRKLSLTNKGRHLSSASLEKLSQSLKGHSCSEATKQKIARALTGRKHLYPLTEKQRQHLSEALKGRIVSLETCKKLSIGRLKDKNPNWRGGVSSESYGVEWDRHLKEKIMMRDNYVCRNPGCKGNSRRLAVHHVNYIKKDNREGNLITLCTSCNSRANRKRELWKTFYEIQLEEICRRQNLIMRKM